jgi:hypothetical protein
MNNITFHKLTYRTLPGNPVHCHVSIFSKRNNGKKQYLSLPFTSQYVLVATTNENVQKYICDNFEVEAEEQYVTMTKHLAENLQMNCAVFLNMSCNLHTKESEWDIYYFTPQGIHPHLMRSHLIE